MKYILDNFKSKSAIEMPDEQVLSLICVNGELEACCGEISALRDAIIDITREGCIHKWSYNILCKRTKSVMSDHVLPAFWIEFLTRIEELNFFGDENK